MVDSSHAAPGRGKIPLILAAAVVQGWSLYALHAAIDAHRWPATDSAWLLGFYALAAIVPTSTQLLVNFAARRALWWFLATLGLAAFGFGWHQGASVETRDNLAQVLSQDTGAAAFELAIWWLLVLPFAQNALAGRRLADYPALFSNAWRNKLTLAETALFTVLFWLLLYLWGQLFHLLNIDFFRELFQKPIFAYPVTALVAGFGLHLVGTVERLIAAVLEQVLNVLKWLGTVAFLMLALFTVALVIEIPQLGSADHAPIPALWLLWLNAVIVLLVNAAFRDGRVARPYPGWLAAAMRCTLPLTVVIGAIAIYSLLVRTREYGLTVDRFWAFVVGGAAMLYALGYSGAALRRDRWLAGIERVNVAVAALLTGVIALALTPVLSPYRLAADSQYRRALASAHLDDAGKEWRKGPFSYLRFHAGPYGRARLRQLAGLQDQPNAERIRTLAARAEQEKFPWNAPPGNLGDQLDKATVYPAGRTIDPALRAAIVANETDPVFNALRYDKRAPIGIFVDLDGDGRDEFVLLGNGIGGVAYAQDGNGWTLIGQTRARGSAAWKNVEVDTIGDRIETRALRWRDFRIGTAWFQVEPR